MKQFLDKKMKSGEMREVGGGVFPNRGCHFANCSSFQCSLPKRDTFHIRGLTTNTNTPPSCATLLYFCGAWYPRWAAKMHSGHVFMHPVQQQNASVFWDIRCRYMHL